MGEIRAALPSNMEPWRLSSLAFMSREGSFSDRRQIKALTAANLDMDVAQSGPAIAQSIVETAKYFRRPPIKGIGMRIPSMEPA
jgi:hypothetical protein